MYWFWLCGLDLRKSFLILVQLSGRCRLFFWHSRCRQLWVSWFCCFTWLQQLENNILVPTIMRKAVGLNPIVSILVILVGAKIFGIIGAVLSIPMATVIAAFFS